MSRLKNLKEANTLKEFSYLLGYKPKAMAYILYKMPEINKYIEFEIPKKNNGVRKIKAPTNKLKLLQRRLAELLNDCMEEIYRKKKLKKSLSHGFRKKHSIVTNAKNHRNKRYVFNIDLKDFFPSINFGRVRFFFIKDRNFNLSPKIATMIAKIVCYKNELPQGSPYSPVISNLIGNLLDIKLVKLGKTYGSTYSRYADDITFSTNKRKFPREIAINNNGKWNVSKKLENTIKETGFLINKNKVSMQYKTSRQTTTGLVVNLKVNIRKEYYKNARAMCNELYKKREFYIKNGEEKNKGTLNQLEGILSFIYNIRRPYEENKKRGKRKNNPTGIIKVYRKFLFYKYFYIISKPLIICKGKTDISYLKIALKQLANQYNEFISINNTSVEYKIKFLKFSKNFKEIFGISRGTSGLKDLLDIYIKDIKLKRIKNNTYPIIMLIDNDQGAEEIKKNI